MGANSFKIRKLYLPHMEQYRFKRKLPHLTQLLIFAHAFQWGRGTDN